MSNHSSSQKQAEALLSQMTVKEKIGQLCQRLYGFDIYHADHGEIHFTEEFKREVEECQGLGTPVCSLPTFVYGAVTRAEAILSEYTEEFTLYWEVV